MNDKWQLWIRPENSSLLLESWNKRPATDSAYSCSLPPIQLDSYNGLLTGFLEQPGYLARLYNAFTLGRLKNWLPEAASMTKASRRAATASEAVPFVKITRRNSRPGYIISPRTRAIVNPERRQREQPQYQRIEVPQEDFIKRVFGGYDLTLEGLDKLRTPPPDAVYHLLVYASPKAAKFAVPGMQAKSRTRDHYTKIKNSL